MLLNRKLILAVLTLGLLLSFCSAAIGYNDTKFKDDAIPVGAINPNAPGYGQEELLSARNHSDILKPINADEPVPPGTLARPIERVCQEFDYTQGGFTTAYTTPSSYTNTHFGNSYSVENACTLKAIGIAQYGPWLLGDPDAVMTLYTGSGAYPTTLVKSWTFPYATLSLTDPQWLWVDLTADAGYPNDYILAAGERFFITGSTIQNSSDDKIRYLAGNIVDPPYDAEIDVGITYVPAPYDAWFTMSEDGWGNWPPRAFLQFADVCYEEGDLSGECYTNSYWTTDAYYWTMGLTSAGQRRYIANRFSVEGPETLISLDMGFCYDFGLCTDDIGDGSGVYPSADVIICKATITGEPDIANPDYAFVVAPEDQIFMNNWNIVDNVPTPLVYTEDFFVVVGIVDGGVGNQKLAFISDDEPFEGAFSWQFRKTPASPTIPLWMTMYSYYGADFSFLMDANMCRDIYATCGLDNNGYCTYSYIYSLPRYINAPTNTLMRKAWGVSFDPAFSGCDMDYIDMWFYGGPKAYDAEVAIYLADGVGGLPGTKVRYIPITGGSWPSGFFKIAPNFYFDASIWVVLESFAGPTHQSDIQIITDDGSCPSGRNALLIEDVPAGTSEWSMMMDIYGFERNVVFDMYRCCYPFTVRTCAPDGDWPTMGKNFERDNSTLNELGDVQCNLTKSWTYKNTTAGGQFNQPIIADGKVFFYMFNNFVCLDVNTGAQLWKRVANFSEISGSCRATPTYKDGFVYCGGGDNGYFSKFDATTGATVWTFASSGNEQYAANVIMDVEGTEVIFYTDGIGNLYGRRTSDGANVYAPGTDDACFYAGGQTYKALTTDGTYLYLGCDQYLTDPNVFRLAVTLAGVTEDWNLVDDGPGWQLQTIVADNAWNPEPSQEGCFSTILYEDQGSEGQWIYFIGEFAPQNSSPVHNGGIIYKVSADGTELGWASETSGNSRIGVPSGIINDKATVIFGSHSNWIEGGEYYGPMAYSKATGNPQWGPNEESPLWNIQSIPDNWGHCISPGVLTCENIADAQANDWLIFGNEFGYWNFANTTVGDVTWSRRVVTGGTGNNAYVVGPVVDEAGHLILANGTGYVHCLTNDVPRPRLHIADMSPEIIVEFGLSSYEEVAFPELLVNNGCADLTIFHVELLDEDNGTFPNRVSTVNSNRAEAISSIAKEKAGYVKLANAVDERIAVEGYTPKIVSFTAAFVLPEYILSLLEPADGTVIPAGGSSDIVLAIDGTKIPRGVSNIYAEIHSDDPDYFLDSAYMDYGDDAADPVVLLSIVGGCIYQWEQIHFGNGGANNLPVYNSSRICTPDGSIDGALNIDGNHVNLFGCDGLFYSDGTQRVVMHATGGGSDEIWQGILPDPLPTCAFATAEDVVLAQMSNDGAAYSNVLGTIMNYAFIDSVEDHRRYEIDNSVSPPETTVFWEWDLETTSGLNTPYSAELTEGFAFKTVVSQYAVTDVTGPKYGFNDFWNFVICRQSVHSRYGYAIPGVYVGLVADWDISVNTTNSSGYSQQYSLSWMYEPAGAATAYYGGGTVKIPFGPGFTPMINSVEATTAWYGGEEPGFDSIYTWMARTSTQFMNYDLGATTDRRLWTTLAKLDLPSWPYTGDEEDPVPESAVRTFGYAFFGKFTGTNPGLLSHYSGMATLANQFCGFGRGDVNNDGAQNLVDIVYLNNYVYHGGNGPFPFKHLGDLNNDGAVDALDITYMINWYFNGGPVPVQDWSLPQFAF